MEMSVGTIVTIVLLMSVLVLGIFLVAGIFDSAGGAIELTDQQLRTELENLFTDDDKIIAIYPDPSRNKPLEIKRGDDRGDEVGIAIRNLGKRETKTYSYEVKAKEVESGCRLDEDKINEVGGNGWIVLGRMGEGIPVREGSISSIQVVRFEIPEDAPLCKVRFTVQVKEGGSVKADQDFDIRSVP